MEWGWGGGGDDDDKCEPVGGIHIEKPREIAHAHTENPSGIMFMDEEKGEPGTGVGSTGP